MLERLRIYHSFLIQHGAEASEAGNYGIYKDVAWPWFLAFIAGGMIFMAVDYIADLPGTLRDLLALPLLFLPCLGMTYAMSVCVWAYVRTDFARHEALKPPRQRTQAGVDVG